MASPITRETPASALDFRLYLGMLFFRWQTIVVCFLYCLLGGVLYINIAPKLYQAKCKIMIYRDPQLELAEQDSRWSAEAHVYLLQSPRLQKLVVARLADQWGKQVGTQSKMFLPVNAYPAAAFRPALLVTVRSEQPGYARDFLSILIEEHQKEWQSMQGEAAETASKLMEEELQRLEEKIRNAQDGVTEFQRLHDILRLEAGAAMENSYLAALVARRSQLSTEIALMEYQYTFLKDANVGVVEAVDALTKESGTVEPILDEKDQSLAKDMRSRLPESLRRTPEARGPIDDGRGWPELRIKLVELQQKEKELAANLTEDHPTRREMRKQIDEVKRQLDVAAQVAINNLRDRHAALQMQHSAVEAAEYKWQAKNLNATQRRSELNRLNDIVRRFESNYNTLYSRLHDIRVSEELKAEHFRVVEPVEVGGTPVWPDPLKILFISVMLGLGSGFGLALLAQTVDNKVQSIRDVENVLGIPFLGGVPYWAHSGLERAIRPIVTEEHSSGAIEAYRALRTSILSALNKMNEKVVLVTSADSREGKTLTTLNLAIMIAQMGKRVLLMDLDLRRGRIHRSLAMEREPGITDVLKTGGSLRDVIRKTRVENLDLAPTGSSTDNSAELLQSTDLVKLFVEIQDDYDYILCDTSPVLRVTDTVILATEGIGVVLYVARVNRTPKPLIRYSLDMLKDARVLGLIMNSIEMHRISSLYYTYQYPNYAYYSNAYSYGYNYYDYGDDAGRQRRPRKGSSDSRWQSLSRRVKQTLTPTE